MMQNGGTVRLLAVAVVFVLLYGSRLTKGSVRHSADGLVFALKPMVIASRIGAVLLYAGFLAYTVVHASRPVPAWFYAVFVAAVGFILLQLPGTIVLGPESVTQSYWFLKRRVIAYGEVMALQAYQAGRAVRVIGDNRVTITHTTNHSAQDAFKAEMEQRTGKRAS